jgi:hypothetical protein
MTPYDHNRALPVFKAYVDRDKPLRQRALESLMALATAVSDAGNAAGVNITLGRLHDSVNIKAELPNRLRAAVFELHSPSRFSDGTLGLLKISEHGRSEVPLHFSPLFSGWRADDGSPAEEVLAKLVME